MAEFNLNCPACRMEYSLPADAIPPEGREVECSGCGHAWHAHPPSAGGLLDLGRFRRRAEAERPIPPARQRLSADVLDILQEEVAHERRLRDADARGTDAGGTDAGAPDAGGPDAGGLNADGLNAGGADPRTVPEPAPDRGVDAGTDPVAARHADAPATHLSTPEAETAGPPPRMAPVASLAPSWAAVDRPAPELAPLGSTRGMTPTAQVPVVTPQPAAPPMLLLRQAALSESPASAPAPVPTPDAAPARRGGAGRWAAWALVVAALALAAYGLVWVLA